MPISVIASIVAPDLVDLPEEAKESRWVVSSSEILLRYVEVDDLKPDIDFADLDMIGVNAQEEFDLIREFLDDNDSE